VFVNPDVIIQVQQVSKY